MRKNCKKMLSLLLALVLCLGLVPVGAFAAEPTSGTCGENVTWTLSNGVLTISGTGEMDNYYYSNRVPWYSQREAITSAVIGNGVTSIGDYAFDDCTDLTSVTIPNTVISIESSAFRGCTSLTSVTIGNSVTSIGNYAFSYCTGLTQVTIPDSVTSIGKHVFHDCEALTSVTIPGSVTSIEESVFEDCTGLISVTIPGSVTSIGNLAFSGCTGLTSVTIPDSMTSIGNSAFYGCTGLTSVTIPTSVTSIGEYAFGGCTGLTNVTIPDSITSIGNYAFSGCTCLTSVTIPDSMTSIGNRVFSGCTCLTSVTIPDSVTSIGNWVFYGCTGLISVTIPTSVTSIGEGAFSGCTGLTSVTIPTSVTSIGERAFSGCTGLTSATIPNSVVRIGWGAFCDCTSLVAINVNSENSIYTSIEGVLFSKDKTTLEAYPAGRQGTYTIPASVTSIGERAFSGCTGLTGVTIPNSVTSIDRNSFYGCTSLISVTIPSSVTGIGVYAFNNCIGLKDVYYDGTATQWHNIIVWYNNADYLNSVTVHYNSTGPDDVGPDNPDNMNPVYFLSGWDAATRTLKFGDEEITPDTYTVADSVDVSSIDRLLNKYVLVTMEQGDSSLEYTITDIQPVESRIGTVSATGEHALAIDGTTYPVRQNSLMTSGMYDGKEILYHVSNGTIVGFNVLEEKSGTLETWNSTTGQATIDGVVYPTNYLSNLSFQNNISDYLQKGVYFVTSGSSDYHPLLRITGFYYPGGKLEDFDPTIYHASWLAKNGNADSILHGDTPSDIMMKQIDNSGAGTAMDVWRSFELVFDSLSDITTLAKFASGIDQKDMYSALILTALEAKVSYDIIPSQAEEGVKLSKSLISNVSSALKADYGIDLNNNTELHESLTTIFGNDSDMDAYLEGISKEWFKNTQPDLGDLGKSFKWISKGVKAVGTAEDYAEYISACITLSQTDEYIKEVLNLAYQKSCSVYGPANSLSLAFKECLDMFSNGTEQMFDKIQSGTIVMLGEGAVEYIVGNVLWSEVTGYINVACPEVAILQIGYTAGKTISSWLCNTDDAVEQYLKMDSITDIESMIDSTYNDLRLDFSRKKDVKTAATYLSAMALSFQLRNIDCDNAYKYVDAIDTSLLNKIEQVFGKEGNEELKQAIQNFQSDYQTFYVGAETDWILCLEEDYPGSGLYEWYSSQYSVPGSSGGGFKLVKEITAACPVDVYVYDQLNNVVASVIDGRVSCSVDDVMIALVGDQKIIRFYDGADYRIEYVGYDTGDMDVTITEFDENEKTTRTVNYYNLALTNGKTYTIDANDDTLKPYNLTDKSDNSTVQHDYDSMDTITAHTIKIVSGTLQQGGELFAETTASKGETLQLNAYVPEGYELVRWESSSTNALIADINSVNTTLIMPDEDLTITAIMRETHSPSTAHTVRFDPNGGTLSGSATLVTSTSGKLSNLPTATRSNYTFDGWYTEISGGDKVTVNYVFTSDATVYAHWTKNSGGSSGGSSSGGGSSGGSSTYPPTVSKPSEGGGAATVSPSNPKQGDTVTVTPKPDEGYEVDKITVTGPDGKTVEVKRNPDGTYTFIQPNGKVKIEVTYKLIEGSWSNPFTDVSEGDWYYAAVRFVQENGLMNGYGEGRFDPNDNLSRAQFAQILFNREGRPVVNYLMQFGDVTGEAWYAEAVRWAASQGIVSGYGNGMFGPNDPITREQLAVMLWRHYGSPAATNKELHFNDANEISGFALEAMRWAVEHGIVNGYGDGRLGPKGQATRAQVAQMLKNCLDR